MKSMPVLLIIGYVWPEPASSAAGRHMLEIIQAMQQANWQIIFASPAAKGPYRLSLDSLHIEEHQIELNSDSFDDWISKLQPDAVMFDRFMMEEQFGWRVAQTCPEAIRILDTEDLHFLRKARQQTLSKDGLLETELHGETALREVASILRCDLTLMISEYEMQLLQDHYPVSANLLHYFPFVSHATNQVINKVSEFERRQDFVFVGTMRHAPNIDAARYLKQALWPEISKRLPGVRLLLAGSYMTKEISQMHKPQQGFHVMGYVKDLRSLLSASRVFLSPLRFGAGLKGKLIEAMEAGLPSVTTATGAEGICAANSGQWPGRMAENTEQLIDAAVTLYQDKQAWDEAVNAGNSLLARRFSAEEHNLSLQRRMEHVLRKRDEIRRQNFVGRMLMHQTMRSTEFMSRWIACKNRIKKQPLEGG